jgi:hypothetical protein
MIEALMRCPDRWDQPRPRTTEPLPQVETAVAPARDPSAPPGPARSARSWRRTAWAAALTLLGAVVATAFWLGAVPRPAPSPDRQPRPLTLEYKIDSTPIGAEVFVRGTNEYLGRTPFLRRFEWREDHPTILIFRLPGYEELQTDVKPNWSGLVRLVRAPQRLLTPVPAPTAVTRTYPAPGLDEINAVVKANQPTIRLCYEPFLSRNKRVTSFRIDVAVQTRSSGAVKSVSLTVPPGGSGVVKDCIAAAVQRWRFPRNGMDYKVEFPLVLLASDG